MINSILKIVYIAINAVVNCVTGFVNTMIAANQATLGLIAPIMIS